MASAHVALSHSRCAALRIEGELASSNKPVDPHCEHERPIPAVAQDHRSFLAQRACGSSLWAASAARGIGSLDIGTEGCFKRTIWPADDLGLRELCGHGGFRPRQRAARLVCTRSAFFCFGPDEQTD